MQAQKGTPLEQSHALPRRGFQGPYSAPSGTARLTTPFDACIIASASACLPPLPSRPHSSRHAQLPQNSRSPSALAPDPARSLSISAATAKRAAKRTAPPDTGRRTRASACSRRVPHTGSARCARPGAAVRLLNGLGLRDGCCSQAWLRLTARLQKQARQLGRGRPAGSNRAAPAAMQPPRARPRAAGPARRPPPRRRRASRRLNDQLALAVRGSKAASVRLVLPLAVAASACLLRDVLRGGHARHAAAAAAVARPYPFRLGLRPDRRRCVHARPAAARRRPCFRQCKLLRLVRSTAITTRLNGDFCCASLRQEFCQGTAAVGRTGSPRRRQVHAARVFVRTPRRPSPDQLPEPRTARSKRRSPSKSARRTGRQGRRAPRWATPRARPGAARPPRGAARMLFYLFSDERKAKRVLAVGCCSMTASITPQCAELFYIAL